MKNATILSFFLFMFFIARTQQKAIELSKAYNHIRVAKNDVLDYPLNLSKNGIYQFSILQQGIAVHYQLLSPDDKMVYESNYPDDIVGYEKFEYTPLLSGSYKLQIKRFDDPENTDSGHISIFIKSLSKEEIALRSKIKRELEPENKKNVLTLDIDHFWQAFDSLK